MWEGSVVGRSTSDGISLPKTQTTQPKYACTFTWTLLLHWNSSTLHSRQFAISLVTAFLNRTTSVFLCKNAASPDKRASATLSTAAKRVAGRPRPTHTKTLKLFLWKIIVTCYFKNKITICIPCESLGHVNLRTIIAHDKELFCARPSKWGVVSQNPTTWYISPSLSLDWAKSPKWTHVPRQMQADSFFG